MSGELIERLDKWLSDFAVADLDEGAADAVTVGMVYQQEAERVWLPRLRAELSALRGEDAAVIARLVGALEPFALEADNHDRPDIKDDYGFAGDIYFGDLRRARQTLTDTAAQRQSVSQPEGDGGLAQ